MTPEQIEKKFKDLEKKICCQLANAGGDSATTSLDNLVDVAINSPLLPDTDNTYDFGSELLAWQDLYAYALKLKGATSGVATIIPPAVAGTPTLTLPTTTGTLALTTQVGTSATRLALTPVDGQEFFQTDAQRDSPPGKYFYLNGQWNYTKMADERMQYYFDDFTYVTAANTALGSYVLTATGTATAISYGVRFSTAASTTGRVVIFSGSNGVFSGWIDVANSSAYMKASLITLTQLSTVAEEFILRVGLTDQGGLAEPSAGAYLEYDRLSSTNWRYVQATTVGSRTETASSTPVTTGAHVLEIFIPVGSGNTEYWVDGVQIATQSATRPAVRIGPMIQFIKSAGSTPVTVDIDYTKAWSYLTTQRL